MQGTQVKRNLTHIKVIQPNCRPLELSIAKLWEEHPDGWTIVQICNQVTVRPHYGKTFWKNYGEELQRRIAERFKPED